MAGYFAETLATLKQFEGCVPWMYRDTAGKVTTGVGLMLVDAQAAAALPFHTAAAPASPEAIRAEFARVTALPSGRAASFYRDANSPVLPEAEIDARLADVLTTFEARLREGLPTYDALPDCVKMALLDMAYNLGPAGLLDGYPRLMQAVRSGAWAQAAEECLRHGIAPARNAWTAKQFLAAGVATIHAEAAEMEASVESWLRRLLRGLRRLFASGR